MRLLLVGDSSDAPLMPIVMKTISVIWTTVRRTTVSDRSDHADGVVEAPRWRRRVARTIDAVAALAVLSLFITPVIALQGYDAPAASALKVLGWVYLGVFVGLAVAWVFKKRHQPEYLTVGMSIMKLRPMRTGQAPRLVQDPRISEPGRHLSARLAAAAGVPLILLLIGLFVYELVLYV